jgi:putative salt-induced outer membrane protein YdiY
MDRYICAPIAMLALAAGAEAAQPERITADLLAHERALSAAMHARDRARLDQLLAPDYVLRGAPDVDRATWLRNALTFCWGDRSDLAAFRATSHGPVAVASFELTFYVDPGTCAPAVLRSVVTDVWVRHAEGWRLAVRHAGPPPAPGAGIAAQYGSVPDPPPAWELDGELSLVATGGNTSTRTLGAGSEVTHRSRTSTTRASAAFVTSEADAVTRARSSNVQVRHGVRAAPRTELFGRAAYARDRFAGIDARFTLDAGASYTASLPRGQSLAVEGGVGYTAEDRVGGADLRFAIVTGALGYAWAIRPGTELTGDLGLTADPATPRNWRGTGTTAVSVTLSRLVSLRASHTVEYRNAPVAGFGRTDMRTAAALVVTLRGRPADPGVPRFAGVARTLE